MARRVPGRGLGLLVATALTLAAAVQAAPRQGPVLQYQALDPTGAVLDNGIVRFRFHFDPHAPLGERVVVDMTDVATGHTFTHRGWRLWKFQLVTQPVPGPTASFVSVTPDMGTGPVLYALQAEVDGQSIALRWENVLVPSSFALETIDVTLQVFLPKGSPYAIWMLHSMPHLQSHAYYTGALDLSVLENNALQHHLLMPLGYLVHEPAAVLATNEPAWFDTQIRPIGQGCAYYDELGNGLFTSFADDTGDATKNFRFGASPDRSAARWELMSYSEDLTDEQRSFHGQPVHVGRFQGDWYDAAAYQRGRLEQSKIASRGLLFERTDVPASLLDHQHTLVLSPLADYFSPCDPIVDIEAAEDFLTPLKAMAFVGGQPPTISSLVTDRIQEYVDYWGLHQLIVAQFSPVWPLGGYDGVGRYTLDPAWAPNALAMQSAGFDFWLYIFDTAYRTAANNPFDDSFVTEGWIDHTVVQLDGTPLIFELPSGGGEPPREYALIDASAGAWQKRMADVAAALSQVGVDGMYIDNFFPDLTSLSYTTTGGHLPGFGEHLTRGFDRTIEAARTAGRELNPQFTIYSEVMFESYIRFTDMHQPIADYGDLVTGDPSTTIVPMAAVMYHHLATLGPTFAGYFTRPPLAPAPDPGCLGFGEDPLTVFSDDPEEREAALRGANYLNAFGWVNGSPIWTPDYGATNPKCFVFSFEIKPPLPGEIDCFREYRQVCSFAATLSRQRGEDLTRPFLHTGRRLRDLQFAPAIPTLDVPLQPVIFEGDSEEVPMVLHGVWQDPATGAFCVAFANHTDDPFPGTQFVFDPAAYGLGSRGHLLAGTRLGLTSVQARIIPGDQPTVLDVPAVAPESTALIIVRPLDPTLLIPELPKRPGSWKELQAK